MHSNFGSKNAGKYIQTNMRRTKRGLFSYKLKVVWCSATAPWSLRKEME